MIVERKYGRLWMLIRTDSGVLWKAILLTALLNSSEFLFNR